MSELVTRVVEKCRIQISASGKAAQEINFPVMISGVTMRVMVGQAIKTCLERRLPYGGVTTRNIHRTLDWLTAPDNDFPSNLDIRGCFILVGLLEKAATLGTR